jgi:integrase
MPLDVFGTWKRGTWPKAAAFRSAEQRMDWSITPRTKREYLRYLTHYAWFCDEVGLKVLSAGGAAEFIYHLVLPRLLRMWPDPPAAMPAWRGMGADGAWIARSALDKLFQETPADQSMRGVAWRTWFDGIIRLLSQEAPAAKAPILRDDLTSLVESAEVLGRSGYIVGYRDQALALMAWACALRPGEIVRLHVGDVVERGRQWLVIPGKRKHRVAPSSPPIPVARSSSRQLDPILALQRWLGCAKIESGPIFRVVHGKANVAERAISTQGITTLFRRYRLPDGVTPHSFRVGFVTQARLDGVSDDRILAVTDHASRRLLDVYSSFHDIAERGPGPLI